MEQEYLGRYRIIGRLGAGGMGTVLRAMDEVRHREVAIKLPIDTDPEVIRRLQRECDVLAQLQHPNIVQVYGSGNDPSVPFYIVMEYVEGTTVEDLLKQRGGPLEPRRALTIGQKVASALAYAHRPAQRIVHRDIKPANVLIRTSDDEVKVTDFGIAAVLSERTGSRTAIGTMAYMAPEQAMGQGIDERTDLYSLGALLYEMLTGQRPPQLASSPARPPGEFLGASLPPDVCSRIDRLTLGVLERDPNRRIPQSAEAMAKELQAILEGRPSTLSAGLQAGAASLYTAQTQRGVLSGPQVGINSPTERAARPPLNPSYPQSAPYAPAYSGPSSTPYPPAYVPPPPPPPPPVYTPPVLVSPPVVAQPVYAQPVYQVVPVVPVAPPRPFSHFAGFALAAGIIALFFALCPVLAIIVNLSTPSTRGALDQTTLLIFAGLNIPALLAILLGHMAQLRIRFSRKNLTGTGTAVTALCFGYFCIAVTIAAYFVHMQ